MPGSNSRPNVSEGYEVPTELPGSTGLLIYASLSHAHYWYEVGMLKVPPIGHVVTCGPLCTRRPTAVCTVHLPRVGRSHRLKESSHQSQREVNIWLLQYFSEYFVPSLPFPHCVESTWYIFFIPDDDDGVFSFNLATKGRIFLHQLIIFM